jgi:hypothetical protein
LSKFTDCPHKFFPKTKSYYKKKALSENRIVLSDLVAEILMPEHCLFTTFWGQKSDVTGQKLKICSQQVLVF